MKILLLTKNGTIQKLFSLSADKRGDEIFINEEISDSYDVVFVDKEILNDEILEKISNSPFKKVLILGKKDEKLPGFDSYLIKPFLPTDLISLLDKISKEKGNKEDDFIEKELDSEDLIINLDDDLDNKEDDLVVPIENIDGDDSVLNEENKDLESKENIDEDITVKKDNFEKENDELEDILGDEFDQENQIDVKSILDNSLDNSSENENTLNEENIDILREDNIMESNQKMEDEILVDDNELDEEGLLGKDILEEKAIETEEKEEVDEEISDIGDEILEDVEEIKDDDLEEEKLDLDLSELDNIDESELAEAIGEDIEKEESKIENEELKTDEKNLIEEENNRVEEKSIEEKTLGNILNINWEELKKAKAKVTITIDFGG